ncbi:MAG TPA: sigma 54-interacting transcriptional regulator [Syntrophales bacterium]|nr:sigma 54-interacting transcriptional regulator [Syntrophales bacterium]
MTKKNVALFQLSEELKDIVYRFAAFNDYFSVDWFSGRPDWLPSRIVDAVVFLEKRRWIGARSGGNGCYEWTPRFPREEILRQIEGETLSRHYREAIDILIEKLPESEAHYIDIAQKCLLAGIRKSDIEIIYRAAISEEKHHHISQAIRLYNHLLEFIADQVLDNTEQPDIGTYEIFIRAVERRASLSLLHPNLKAIDRFLSLALDMSACFTDLKTQASLQLLIGQNYWMSFQYEKALYHFDQGWEMVGRLKDDALYRRALQLQGLSHWIKGDLSRAIQSYENSLGKLDSIAADDFSLLTALHLALCYTQMGMPHRGMGISDSIHNQAKKNSNWPLASYALTTTGTILLEIRQLENSQTYFEKALALAQRERVPMAEVLAGIGLSDIECIKGHFDRAAEHFKVLWEIPKSSWYHTLNTPHVFDAGYRLMRHNMSPVELGPVVDYLYQLKKGQLNPLVYATIRRLQIQLMEDDNPPQTKIQELLQLKKMVEKSGATLERAKIRIDLARLYLQMNNWQKAEIQCRKAWDFLKPIAKDVFPSDMRPLIPPEPFAKSDRLFDLVIEMGGVLGGQKNSERLIIKIITAVSRLTGAERAAIFIKDGETGELNMVASRNLIPEDIPDATFSHIIDIVRTAADSNDGGIIQCELEDPEAQSFRRVIAVPLMIEEGRSMGALYQDGRFCFTDMDRDGLKLLSALASQIAVSIDRVHAYDKIARLQIQARREQRQDPDRGGECLPVDEIIGVSKAVEDLHELIHKVALTQSTVIINGETGVGKELVARAVHRASSRRKGPFIRVNCAALPETLIDSELFGHEKGAFTGAIRTKEGRFELADNGTIFLDEVSELPLSTQSRLLRILQEKEYQRVGGTRTLHSDFRLITASNKNLADEVAQGRFRADLFFRLNIFPIDVPPLRARKEDIPPLASHFLKLFCARYDRVEPDISASEMEKMQAYPWPGNVRELANMMERAVILGEPRIKFLAPGPSGTMAEADNRPQTLLELEKEHIRKTIALTHGKIGGSDGASALLGLKRTTLIKRMKRLGITVEKSA